MLFIFGLGYAGKYVGCALLAKGWRVGGTTRTPRHADELKSQGFEAIVWGGETPLPKAFLEGATHILVTIPPDEKGDVALRHADFSTLPPTVKWIGYLSATSVYGDHQGAWVTESSPLNPLSSRGQQRLLAETQWVRIGQSRSLPLHIFRLSGIYGPGRSVLEGIRSGRVQRIGAPKDRPGLVFSRIHVEDIAAILEASMVNPQPGAIYNLADDEPAATADVIVYACGLLGQEAPPLIPFEEAASSLGLRAFYAESKRISNHKVKDSLGIRLTYPTYRDGITALLKSFEK